MHRRRAAGIGAIKNKTRTQALYKDKGSSLASEQLEKLSGQLESFQTYLENFARKHKEDIRKSPEFRNQFQQMCSAIGVDPLASGKGFWSEMLGVGDFYYELGVRIIEVCMATNHRNGGLMSMGELRNRLMSSRGRSKQDVSTADLLMAIKKLKTLGNGFSVIAIGGSYLIQSVPGELTMDHTAVIQQAEGTGYVTKERLRTHLRWEDERARRALEYLVKEGLVWVDDQAPEDRQYWFPGLFQESIAA